MLREGMKDYDDLALFRRKSGNAHFELRPVSDPSLSAGEADDEALLSRPPAQTTAPQGMLRQVVASPLNPPAQPALSLTTTAPEQALRARRARLAGLFRHPEPLPTSRAASSGTLLKPLLRRIAEQSRRI